jgi:epoxyqueuosine reductase QueG
MSAEKDLRRLVFDWLETEGAVAVGVSTRETLAGGPASTDLDYVLPGAKSAISFAVPFNEEKIERFLAKKDHAGHQKDNFGTNIIVSRMAYGLGVYLDEKGHPSKGTASNAVYRKDQPRGIYDFKPDISHRYLAVRCGVGWFGLSGNVITKTHGASIVLGTTVTTAELEPTEPLPSEENYCNQCKLCFASCNSGLMHKKEMTTVRIGGLDFSYSKRLTYRRCDLVCGGFTGLAKNGKWSTWSPGRFPIPEREEDFRAALVETMKASAPRPEVAGGFQHPAMPKGRKINQTCGNCQLICHPEEEERKRRYKLLTKNGVVVQNPDGTLQAVSPGIAKKHLAEMSGEQRAMYEKV